MPGADILAGVLTPASKRTVCPYKGEATYWSVKGIENGAWSYETPLPESIEIRAHVSFDGEGIETEVDDPADRFSLGRAAT